MSTTNGKQVLTLSIRSACKAILYHDGKVLLNRLQYGDKILYDLPGCGQRPYESIEEAVLREVAEETGYSGRIERFCGLTEEITRDE